MFSSRRYQPVSQHVESESDSDEATIFSVENGNSAKQKGEWHFGVRAYDLNQDLDLPQIRPTHHHPSRRSKDNLRGYTRKQALFGACVFVVIVTVITTLAVLILMKESNTTTITDDSANEDCNKAPKPIVNFAGGDVGSPPPPGCGKGNVTTEQKNTSPPPTQPRPATTSSETVSNVETEASPSKGGTKAPPSREGVTETRPQLPLTTHTAEAIQQKTTTLPEVPMTNSEAPPTTIPLDEGDIMKSTTPQSAAELPTATTQSHVTTTTSQDEQLLKNWSEKIASEITQPAVHLAQTTTQQPTQPESTESTQTPPTTTLTPPTNMSTPPTTTLILPTEEATSVNEECNKAPKPLVNFVDGDVSSPPPPGCGKEKEQQNTTSESSKDKDKVSEAPTMKPQSIDWEQDFFPAMSEATIELFDMNSDGVMDVVTVEDFSQCAARVVAMDGQNGTKFWQKVVNFPAFGVHCELDVNSDGTKDCLVTGRGAGFVAINGQNGSLLWDVDPSIAFPLYNFYFPLIVEDLDDDGVSDIINMHGGDVSYNPDEHNRSPGYLVVVSGKTGQSLFPPMLTPDGHESYMSPVLFKLNGKDNLVLFGSGGETVPGSLWAVSLTSIRNQVILNRARQSWKGGVVYEPFVNDTHHPCFMKGTDFNKIRPTFDHQAFDFKRPIFVTSAANSMRFCPSWEKVSPIWNKYGVCLYELYRAESKGVMVPPVIVDLNLDGIDDVVVSSFDGHTVALNGSDAATRLWDAYYPNTESYSVPTPLYYNQDSIPDILIRCNFGEWNEYNVSTLRLLDGRNGAELWSFDSAHTGMMSSLSIASKSAGSDAMLFMTIGTLDSGSDTDSSKWQRVRRHEHNPINADASSPGPEGVEGEAELMEDGDKHQGGVDYDDDFMSRAMSYHDPPDLWISTPDDQFPDPNLDADGFMIYCGESFPRLTTYLWLVTREMVEKGEELKPIAVHEPFIFTLPEAPPEGFPSDGPPPDNFQVPPEAEGAGPVSKRHGDVGNPDAVDKTQTKKMMRCSHISAPLQVIASPAVGDFDSDGRLDIAYSVVWSSISPGGMGTVPEFKVFAFTLEERYRQMVVGPNGDKEAKDQKVIDFELFLPADQQPWSRYMGRHGNNTYHRGG